MRWLQRCHSPGELGRDVTREEVDWPLVEEDPAVGKEELPCAVMEPVRNTLAGSPVVLGCLVVRLVAGELGMAVTPRVEDRRPCVGARVVREVDFEVVDREDRAEEVGLLGVVWDVDRTMVLGVGRGDSVGEDGGEREGLTDTMVAGEKRLADRGAVCDMVTGAEGEGLCGAELVVGMLCEVETAEGDGEYDIKGGVVCEDT